MPTASAANNNIERVLDEYLSPSPPSYQYVCVWRQIRFLRLYAKHFLCIKKQKRKRTTTTAQEGCCKQVRGRGRGKVRSHHTQDAEAIALWAWPLPGPYSHNRYFALRRVLIYAFFSMEKYTHTHTYASYILSAESCVERVPCPVPSSTLCQGERVFLLCFWVIY